VSGATVTKAAVLDGDIPIAERRTCRRVPLRCTLSILTGRGVVRELSSVTENLSSQGFCCVLGEAFAPGDGFACILRLPRQQGQCRALRCEVRVVWTTMLDNGCFYTGCRIEGYNVVY